MGRPAPRLDGRIHNFTWVSDGVADTILFYFDGVQQLTTLSRLDSSVSHFYTGHPINPTGTDGAGVAGPMSLNTFDIVPLKQHTHFEGPVGTLIWLLIFFGFASIAPIWPLHSWSPVGHAAAPAATSMLHAGVLMKLGQFLDYPSGV